MIQDCNDLIEQRVEQENNFSSHCSRLELKFREKIIDHFTKVAHEIIGEFQKLHYQHAFKLAFTQIPYQPHLLQRSTSTLASVKKTIANSMSQEKQSLDFYIEHCTHYVLKPLLDTLTIDLIEIIASVFLYDMAPSNISRRKFRQRLKKISQTTFLKFHQDILNSILQSVRPSSINMDAVIRPDYLPNMTQSVSDSFPQSFAYDAHDYSQQDDWRKFGSKFCKEFLTDLKKLDKSRSAVKRYINLKRLDECIEYGMVAIKSLYINHPATQDKRNSRVNNMQDVLEKCIYYLKNVIPLLRKRLNEIHMMNPNWWPITPSMIHIERSHDHTTHDYIYQSKDAILKRGPACDHVKVRLRRLSGEFCAAHVRLREDSTNALRHPNILHFHGVFCTDGDVIIVTEPWEMTLREAVTSGSVQSLNLRLQMAIQLTELCVDMGSKISAEQLKPDSIVITQDHQIKVNIATLKPPSHLNSEHGDTRIANRTNILSGLGTIFKFLFMQSQENSETIPSLCLLINRCSDETAKGHFKPPTLEEILGTLKFEQVSLHSHFKCVFTSNLHELERRIVLMKYRTESAFV